MLYARLSQDGTVLRWPLREQEVRALLPNVSLPRVIRDVDLEGTGFVLVPPIDMTNVPKPTKDKTIRLSPVLLAVNGRYQRQYETVDIPEHLKGPRLEQRWQTVRRRRDQLIQRMEWRVARHAREVRLGLTPTDDIAKLDAYIQALADITNQEDPFAIVWPEVV